MAGVLAGNTDAATFAGVSHPLNKLVATMVMPTPKRPMSFRLCIEIIRYNLARA